jgi:hypothetical protein
MRLIDFAHAAALLVVSVSAGHFFTLFCRIPNVVSRCLKLTSHAFSGLSRCISIDQRTRCADQQLQFNNVSHWSFYTPACRIIPSHVYSYALLNKEDTGFVYALAPTVARSH